MEREDSNNPSLKLQAENILKKACDKISGLNEMVKQVKSPTDIDSVSTSLGLIPCLANFSLATEVETPLGNGLHIPVQISNRDGGRKSLYYLEPNEETLAGMYVIEGKIYKRYIRRESGQGVPAKTGDSYSKRITTLEDKNVYSTSGTLEIWNPSLGIGTIKMNSSEKNSLRETEAATEVWILWSCINIK